MKRISIAIFLLNFSIVAFTQSKTSVKEYKKVFTTYPFSDPNPIPDPSVRYYPYFRYDGFTTKPELKSWKVVELENDYLKVTIMPEIGGKIWSATEKKTGKDFLYNNHVVKFRDVAMRGPWTSGGIEANYGILGHTPNCATPVDYITIQKNDGSASCIIGVLDLLTQTKWRLEINLAPDRAYFTTTSFWYNASLLEEPYYTWMNTGIKAKGNLEFIYPGYRQLGHEGEVGDWPTHMLSAKQISFYEENDFGGYKSYHVFGNYTDFFGGYWHDDDYGMGHYATHADKPGKKIWIWGLSRQGMIWEKLLTDNDGQYVEVQSGRLFNQSLPASMFTPFKYRAFTPGETDGWTEYWFPVLHTNGFVKANENGAFNLREENGWLKIDFCPIQPINEELKLTGGDINYTRRLVLQPLQTFSDSFRVGSNDSGYKVSIGAKIEYHTTEDWETELSRPVESPKDFDWNSVYGLYLAGKSLMEQRNYGGAEIKIRACLEKDKNFVSALAALSELAYRKLNYDEAFEVATKALSINTYDAASNYYYGLAALKLNKPFDAKDGFDIASQSAEYRVAAFTRLAEIFFKEKDFEKAEATARKSLDYNRFNIDALQLLAILYRKTNNITAYSEAIIGINDIDPLNHFVSFEKFIRQESGSNKTAFFYSIQNELPSETCMDLVSWYFRLGCVEEVKSLLRLAPPGPEVSVWRKYYSIPGTTSLSISAAFPFRQETAEILSQFIRQDSSWLWRYYLGLIYQYRNNTEIANVMLKYCDDQPTDPSFYSVRARIGEQPESDLLKAISLDKEQWRFYKQLAEYYLDKAQYEKALPVVENYYHQHPANYIIGMLYAKALLLNQKYKACDELLGKLNIIPFEGATEGRQLYREAKLMRAMEAMNRKDSKRALQLIGEARLWPENLGEGKPYEKDIDERLENWMAYLCYQKLKQVKLAEDALQKVLNFRSKTDNTLSVSYSANNLVSAWALEKRGEAVQASILLNERVNQNSSDKILLWVKKTFEKKGLVEIDSNDATVRLIKRLMQIGS